MVNHIMICPKCKNYMLSKFCDQCDIETILPRPVKFSIEDHYGKYRRMVKENKLKRDGLL